MMTSSANVDGFVSTSIWRTNRVPNSGTPSVPVLQLICSVVTPILSVLENIFITSGSSIGMSFGLILLISWSILMTVGLLLVYILSFNKLFSIFIKLKCVVFILLFVTVV